MSPRIETASTICASRDPLKMCSVTAPLLEGRRDLLAQQDGARRRRILGGMERSARCYRSEGDVVQVARLLQSFRAIRTNRSGPHSLHRDDDGRPLQDNRQQER